MSKDLKNNSDENSGLTRPSGDVSSESAENKLLEQLTVGKERYARIVLAALGSLPWVGVVFSVTLAISAEKDKKKTNELQKLWLQEHREKAQELGETLRSIFSRLDNFGDEIQGRIESAMSRSVLNFESGGSVVERLYYAT